uniref:Uncharacterized protein n=1 Tax=Athene cunicularia TaxID=194338 RepID=A0A663MSB1_ATHCN
ASLLRGDAGSQLWQPGAFHACLLRFQIQKLCDRVASSTLLDDRRDAVRALKSLSKVKPKSTCYWAN